MHAWQVGSSRKIAQPFVLLERGHDPPGLQLIITGAVTYAEARTASSIHRPLEHKQTQKTLPAAPPKALGPDARPDSENTTTPFQSVGHLSKEPCSHATPPTGGQYQSYFVRTPLVAHPYRQQHYHPILQERAYNSFTATTHQKHECPPFPPPSHPPPHH